MAGLEESRYVNHVTMRCSAQFHCAVELGHFVRQVCVALSLVALTTSAPSWIVATYASSPPHPRALVLEPFSSQYSVENAGKDEVHILESSGFDVTVLRDSAVTVGVMRHLSRYAFVYIYTHVGPLPNNDAAIATGDTQHHQFRREFANYTLVQMHIVTDGTYHYFDAITGLFVHRYDGAFPAHTIVFLNGCTALGMPRLWHYLHESGVSTLISWRHHVTTVDASVAARNVIIDMAEGKTVRQAIRATRMAGAGISVVNGKTGVMSFIGDGTNTLYQAGRSDLHPRPFPLPRCSVYCPPAGALSSRTAARTARDTPPHQVASGSSSPVPSAVPDSQTAQSPAHPAHPEYQADPSPRPIRGNPPS